jgi:hypothetical protein
MQKLGSRGRSPAQRAEIGLGLLLLIVAAQLAGSVIMARSAAARACVSEAMSARSGSSGDLCHVR